MNQMFFEIYKRAEARRRRKDFLLQNEWLIWAGLAMLILTIMIILNGCTIYALPPNRCELDAVIYLTEHHVDGRLLRIHRPNEGHTVAVFRSPRGNLSFYDGGGSRPLQTKTWDANLIATELYGHDWNSAEFEK